MKSSPCAAVTTLLIAVACTSTPKEPIPTYRSYLSYFDVPGDTALQSLREKFEALEKPSLQITAVFDSSWNFVLGDKAENFKTLPKEIRGTPVNLQHRLTKPDQAFWYSRMLKLDQPGVLTISADDGAQLFIDRKPVHRLHGNHFPIDTAGSLQVTIRVLNNAMAGGLRHVEFSTYGQFHQYEKEKQFQRRREAVVEKIVLLQSPTAEMIRLARGALDKPDSASLIAAEQALEDHPFLIGPWLQQKESTTMIVSVESESKHPVRLVYGTTKGFLLEEQVKPGGMAFFELKELLPDTVYYYQIASGKTVSPVYSFKTHQHPASFTFNVWADSQSGWEAFQQNVRNLEPFEDAFGIGAGDLVSNGSNPDEWKKLFKILGASSAGRQYHLVAGNHDYDGYYDDLDPANYKRYLQHSPSNYFSWTYGNCAFIALDPNEDFPIGIPPASKQYQWFHQQLASEQWKKAQWHFVILHQPPISQGWAGYQGDAVIRALLEPVIESAHIDFVIAGHTHDYERLTKMYGDQRTTFLIVGGAGGSLEDPENSPEPEMDTVIKVHHMGRFYIRNNSLRFEAIDLQNNVIDFYEQEVSPIFHREVAKSAEVRKE